MMTLSKAITCRTRIRLVASLTNQRNFWVFLGNLVNRMSILNDGLPTDPYFLRRSSTYADVWTLATQSNKFSHHESKLSLGIGHLTEHFAYWKLRLNAKKTVATCFHLDNKQAAQETKSATSGRTACTRLCTKVPRGDSRSVAGEQKIYREYA